MAGASSGSAIKGATTSRILNKLSYAFANKATDITTAATGDLVPMIDISADYELKFGDASNLAEIMGATQADITKLAAIGASAAEIDNAADVSARVEEHTASGAVTAGVQSVEINSVAAVALTIADAANHPGLFIVKHTSSSDAQSHTLTLTSGTFDGTNSVALLNAANEALVTYFDSAGDGTIVENVGSVSLG